MELKTAFKETWNEVETAFKHQHICNHDLLAFVLFKALGSNAPDLNAIYDAKRIPDQGDRPNLVIWANDGEPTVIFMGEVKFNLENLTVLYQEIKRLNEYANRPLIEVLSAHDSTKIMKVSPNVEFGYFVISNMTPSAISEGVISLGLSHHDLARFHFAYGSVNGRIQFEYQEPRLKRVKK